MKPLLRTSTGTSVVGGVVVGDISTIPVGVGGGGGGVGGSSVVGGVVVSGGNGGGNGGNGGGGGGHEVTFYDVRHGRSRRASQSGELFSRDEEIRMVADLGM